MSQKNSKDQQSRIIKRTLCVGVGGTGRDILMQIRRLIIDRYGRLSNLPIVSFVHIDTDQRAGDTSGLKTGSTYRGEDILFSPAERVVTSMNKQTVDELKSGLARRSAYETQSPHDHIGCWLSPHLLENVKAVEDGASGIRPVGRLAFFKNFASIQDSIQAAARRTLDREQFLLEKGFVVEPSLDIFVVGSLCGGTGSGMCLDIAYGLRKIFEYKKISVIGYWVINPELYGNTPGMGANVYAALKELNHYSASNTTFESVYDPQRSAWIREQRPPFDYLYLVGNKTLDQNYEIQSKRKLSNIIANKILLDCCDELTSSIKGQLVNFDNHLARMDEHPRRNVQRYLTFGLAKIYFPDDLTVQVALNRVKYQFIEFWLNGKGQSQEPKILLDSFLLKWKENQSNRNIFVSRLEQLVQDHNKLFPAAIKSWVNMLQSKINTIQKIADIQPFLQEFKSDSRSQFRKVQPGETDNTRGSWLTLVRKSHSKLVQSLKGDIKQFLSELLKPENPDFCLENARSWLEAMRFYLSKSQRELEDNLQDSEGLYGSEILESRLGNVVQRLVDIEQERGLFGFRKNNNQKFQLEAQQGVLTVKKIIQHNFDYILNQESLNIIRELQQYIQTLTTQASNLKLLFQATAVTYESQSKDLVQLHESDLTGEALFMEVDTDECYQNFLPNHEQLSTLTAVSMRILEESGSNGTLLHWLEQEHFLDEQQVFDRIDTAVESNFGTLKSAATQSVTQRFLQKYPFSRAETRIKQIWDMADPLLPLNLGDPYFNRDPQKKADHIGLNQSDSPESREFINLLTNKIGLPESVLKSIQNQSEIILVKEYAAFPLRLINGLEQMRAHYRRQCELDRTLVHSDFRYAFGDIIPPPANDVKDLQVTFYGCLALHLLEEHENHQGYGFQYQDRREQQNYITLSYSWAEALEQLANSFDISRYLKEMFTGSVQRIQSDPRLWDNQYKIGFNEFWNYVEGLPENHPNYLEKTAVVGRSETLEQPEEKGVLSLIRDLIENKIRLNPQYSLQGASHNSQTSLKLRKSSTSTIHEDDGPIDSTIHEDDEPIDSTIHEDGEPIDSTCEEV